MENYENLKEFWFGICDGLIPHKDNKIQIEISDSGIRMTEQEITMALNGNGIGMPIVKQLMELIKGEMRIESEKGRGTKVILSFSLDEDAQKTTITQIYAA